MRFHLVLRIFPRGFLWRYFSIFETNENKIGSVKICRIKIPYTVAIFCWISVLRTWSYVNLNLHLSRFQHFVDHFSVCLTGFPIYHAIDLNFPIVYESYISCWNHVPSNLIVKMSSFITLSPGLCCSWKHGNF